MAFRFFIVLCLFNISVCFAQTPESNSIQNTKINDTIAVEEFIVRDSIVVDHTRTVKVIEAEIDSTSINNLKDNEFVLKLDEAWFEELYSNRLFDTIYKSVSELD
ncbi:MAG: lytic transglycosylase, partial [Algibacter sp.]